MKQKQASNRLIPAHTTFRFAGRSVLRMLLAAILILLAGALLLLGVQALLPDRMGQYRSHPVVRPNLVPDVAGGQEPVLYPWNELIHAVEPDDTQRDRFLYSVQRLIWLQEPFLDMVLCGEAVFYRNASGTMLGWKDVEVFLYVPESESTQYAYADDTTIFPRRYYLSAAFALSATWDDASWQLCSLCLREADPEPAEPESLQKGYDALIARAKDPYTDGNPFYTYLGTLASNDDWFGEKAVVSSMLELFVSCKFDCRLYGNTAYFRYGDGTCSMILLCNPLTQRVIGFSWEHF